MFTSFKDSILFHSLAFYRTLSYFFFFFSSTRRHTRLSGDWSSDVCSSDLTITIPGSLEVREGMVKLREGEVIFPQGFDFEPFCNVQLILAAPQPSKSLPSNQPGEGGRQDARAQPPAVKHQPKAPDSQPTGDTEDPAGQPATPAAPTASNTPTPEVAPKSRERVEKSRRQPTLRVVAGAAEGVEKGAEPTMAP